MLSFPVQVVFVHYLPGTGGVCALPFLVQVVFIHYLSWYRWCVCALPFLVQVVFMCCPSWYRWCLCIIFHSTGGVCALPFLVQVVFAHYLSWYRWCLCIIFPGTDGVCALPFLVQVIQVMLFGVFCGLITDKGVCAAVRPDTDDAVCTEMLRSIRHMTHLRRYLTRCWWCRQRWCRIWYSRGRCLYWGVV